MSETPDARPDTVPTGAARLICAVPLFLFLALLAAMCCFVPKLDQMYKEMELGYVPPATQAAILFTNVLINFWPLTAPAVVAFVCLYYSWLSREHKRMWWFAAWLFAVSVVLWVVVFWSLLAPMFTVLEPRT